MKIAIGADHAGWPLKASVSDCLVESGHEIVDLGTDSQEPVDYPALSAAVAHSVRSGRCDLGIMLGGSGQGEQIAANKVKGIRAALCNDLYTARMARSHNDANVLTIGARVVAPALACEIVLTFTSTPFEGGRHAARIRQIAEIEEGALSPED